MKKGIEVTHEWVPMRDGELVTAVHVKKAKGELTLTEIQYDEDTSGDMATVYIASDLMGLTAEDYD